MPKYLVEATEYRKFSAEYLVEADSPEDIDQYDLEDLVYEINQGIESIDINAINPAEDDYE